MGNRLASFFQNFEKNEHETINWVLSLSIIKDRLLHSPIT
jgi:hypothetical protein